METTLDKVENAATMSDETKQALATIGKRAEPKQEARRQPKGKVKQGPEQPDELERIMQDVDSTLDDFTRQGFIDGIKNLVKAEHFAAVNQKVLGEFVSRYLVADAKTQATLRLSYVGNGEYPKHFPTNATPTQQLAEVMFADYPALFEKSTSGSTLAEKRLSNWVAAFKGEVKKAKVLTNIERNAALEAQGYILPSTAEATAEEHGIKVTKPTVKTTTTDTTKRKRMSESAVIGKLYAEASNVASFAKQQEYRRWLIVAAKNIGIDPDKVDDAVSEILMGVKNVEPMQAKPAEKTV